MLPTPGDPTLTGFATEACSRRIAQLAAPYHAVGISSSVADEAELLSDGRYRLVFTARIDYGQEVRAARVVCIVTPGGLVQSIEKEPMT